MNMELYHDMALKYWYVRVHPNLYSGPYLKVYLLSAQPYET